MKVEVKNGNKIEDLYVRIKTKIDKETNKTGGNSTGFPPQILESYSSLNNFSKISTVS